MKVTMRRQPGNTILELLIAVAVLAVVLTSIVYSMSVSIKNSDEAEHRQVASRLAQEVIELLRKDKATLPWSEFVSTPSDNTYCINTSDFSGIQDLSYTTTVADIPTECDEYSFRSLNVNYRRGVTKETSGIQVKYTIYIFWNTELNDPEQLRSTRIEQIFYRTE